jgi:DNA replication protein DnaC
MSAPAPAITPGLRTLMRQVKLGQLMATLPERLALARARELSHAEFLELILSDEVSRREATSAARRARAAGLDPAMRLENFDAAAAISYDHQIFDELFSLRFVDNAANALIMGPVGTGKTFVATALGHAAVRRRATVHFERADKLLKRLKAARLDNSHDTEWICSSWTTSACSLWTPPTPPASTRSSSNGTVPPPRSQLPTASPWSGWR